MNEKYEAIKSPVNRKNPTKLQIITRHHSWMLHMKTKTFNFYFLKLWRAIYFVKYVASGEMVRSCRFQ